MIGPNVIAPIQLDAGPSIQEDNSRVLRLINQLIMVVFLLLIFDGSLRKWVFPASLSTPGLLIKDAVVMLIYAIALRHRLFPNTALAKAGNLMAFIFLALGILQIYLNNLPMFPVFYGWRNYFMLVPFVIIMQQLMGWDDIRRMAKVGSYLIVASAVLVFFQYLSPPTAFINKSIGDADVFTVVNGVVRPYGFFSFTNGHTSFASLGFSLVLFNFLLPPEEQFLKPVVGLGVLFAVLVNILLSGSRTAFAQTGITIFFLLLAGLIIFRDQMGFKVVFLSIFGILLGGVLAMTLFGDSLANMQRRQSLAVKSEGSSLDRALKPFTHAFTDLPKGIPVWGKGLGVGSSAFYQEDSGPILDVLIEGEWQRIMVEAGVFFGFFYIVFRVGIAIYLMVQSWRYLLLMRTPILLILYISIFQTLLMGQMTFNNTSCYFGWVVAGLCLALDRELKESLDLQRSVGIEE